jgi:hypothetical protein
LTGQQQDQPSRRSRGPDSGSTALVPFPGSRTRPNLDPKSTGSSWHFLWAHRSANGGGPRPLGLAQPFHPNIPCGRVLRTPAEPRRVGIIRPCAPYDPLRRTRSFPVGKSPSPVVGDHALSSELSLITLYRTYGTEMISTLADMINPYVSSHGRTTEDVEEPIHLISLAAS